MLLSLNCVWNTACVLPVTYCHLMCQNVLFYSQSFYKCIFFCKLPISELPEEVYCSSKCITMYMRLFHKDLFSSASATLCGCVQFQTCWVIFHGEGCERYYNTIIASLCKRNVSNPLNHQCVMIFHVESADQVPSEHFLLPGDSTFELCELCCNS